MSARIVEWAVIVLLFTAPLWVFPIWFFPDTAKMSLILAVVILILGTGALKSWAKKEITLRIPWVFVGAILFAVASLTSLISAPYPYFVLSSLAMFCLFLAFGLVIAQLGIAATGVRRILGALLAASGIASLIAVLQYVGLLSDPILHPVERVLSTFGNRNYLGSFLGVMAFPSLALLLSLRRTWIWYVAWLAGALCFLVPVLVQQTGVLVALLAGFAFIIVAGAVFGLGRYVRAHYKSILAIFLAGILGIGIGLTLWRLDSVEEVHSDATTISTGIWISNSGYTREVYWGTAWEMFKANTWTGVGLGNYKVEFLEYKSLFFSGSRGASYTSPVPRAEQVHNEYLQVLAELGIPGALAIVLIILLAIGTSWIRCRSLPTASQRLEFLLLISGVVVASVHALVSFPYHLPLTSLSVVTILGLVSSSYFGERTIMQARIVGSRVRIVVLVGSLLLCLLASALGGEFVAHLFYSQGVTYMAAGEHSQAQDLLERSVATSIDATQARFQLASVAYLRSDQASQRGDLADATSLLQIAWSNALLSQAIYPTDQGLYLLAEIAVMLDDGPAAEAAISRLLTSRPRRRLETDARYLLALLDANQGNLEAAQQAARNLIQEFPLHVQSYILLGQLLLQEGSPESTETVSQLLRQALGVVESKLLRIETDLKTADSRQARSTLVYDQQRLFTERQWLAALLEGR
ncbi:O-antigen ligase family protein [Candidatus Bipolaricaulota bacterium]